MTMTKLEKMINPQVLASMVDGELEFALKFTNLATIDNTLVGRPGNTVSLPAYKMIGEAVDVAEGEAIPVEALATEMENVTVKKAGKGVRLTDEAILSGYGDPLGQASKQLASKNLPIEFAAMLKGNDAEKTFNNIQLFEAKFNEAVEKVVTERLRGNVPKTNTSLNSPSITKEQFKKMDLMQRQKLFNDDRELYNELSKN